MAAKSPMVFLLLLLVAASITISAAQTSHLVGEGMGWTIPPGGAITYATWAATKTFAVLDKLVFNFTNGAHNVAEVSKADFDACTTATLISLHATSPATVTLNTQGGHYFICNFTNHCSFGEKLAINVTASSSSTPTPSPTPSSSPSSTPGTIVPSTPTRTSTVATPPAGSSATSLGVTGFSTVLFSIAVSFFY